MRHTTLQDLLYVCDHMRAEERDQQVLTFRRPYVPAETARFCWTLPGPKFTLIGQGLPAVVGGAAYEGGGMWELWLVSTPKSWEFHAKSATKACKWLVEAVFEQGARRVITYELESRVSAMDWLERSLGMHRSECVVNERPGLIRFSREA